MPGSSGVRKYHTLRLVLPLLIAIQYPSQCIIHQPRRGYVRSSQRSIRDAVIRSSSLPAWDCIRSCHWWLPRGTRVSSSQKIDNNATELVRFEQTTPDEVRSNRTKPESLTDLARPSQFQPHQTRSKLTSMTMDIRESANMNTNTDTDIIESLESGWCEAVAREA